ncbi:iron-sulfur cluster biosynthesis family protein [Brevibacillus sp. H7]|uniref:iron-sulfur cluster biosynthesis family protein n=1 Tax=Brevibacillus sp. H7 TaxID=3349138 RepID=UPI0038029301
MKIHITEAASTKLASLTTGTGRLLRVNGELVGGCGMNVEYSLVWDDRHPQDTVFESSGFDILVDPETEGYIGSDHLTIDYRENQGFRLVTPQQILAYALHLKDRWA